MAGLGGLPYFIQYQGQLQQQEQAKQQQQMQLMQFQQQQQDRQRAQAAQAAAGNALPQLFQGGMPSQQPQMPPPPQPPAPGQGSQPMQQAGGGVPLPQGPVPGQVLRPPIPPEGVRGSMPPPGVPPFRPMPTTPPPQAAAPQGEIPAPPTPQQQPAPQGGLFTLENAVKALQGQGLQGADLMAGLGQMMPLLDAQAKQQAGQLQQQFQHELQIAQLQERYDALKQRAQDNALNREDRMAARQASDALRLQIAEMSQAGRAEAQAGRGWQVMTDPQTNKLVRVNAATGAVEPFAGATEGLTKPLAGGAHPTEAENKAGMNYTTMKNAQDEMERLEKKGVTNLANLATYQVDNAGHISAITKAGIRRALTPDEQAMFQAAQQFAEGAGHLKSGARINPDTLNVMTSLYIPQAGDSPELVARKKAARLNDLEAGKIAAGRSLPKSKTTSAPAAENTKTIGGKTYIQRDGKWFEQ